MTENRPRVSIGLPIYNAEKYLDGALNSILAQTYTDFELIISDNASTDRTRAICQAFVAKDKRIRYYRNDKNLGVAPNFNCTFKLSSGEYFKWAADDDSIAPEFLARCVEVLERNRDVVLCYTRAKIIDEHGAFVVDYNPGPDTSSNKRHDRFRSMILAPEYAVQQMGLIRAGALRKTGLHASYPSSDEVLLAELALLGEYYEIPDRLFFYRIHSAQQAVSLPQRERVPFYDTSLVGKIVLPKWLYFFACLRAINRVPLRVTERASCYLTMVRWLLKPPHFRAMGKDVLLAANQLRTRDFTQPEASPQHTE